MARTFYKLAYVVDDLNQNVSDYDEGAFDLTVFWKGRPFSGSIPAYVKLYVCAGKHVDLLPNPLSWRIVSTRLKDMLNDVFDNSIQFFHAPLYYEETFEPIDGFHVMNSIKCVDAFDQVADVLAPMRIIPDKIPENLHIFRAMGQPNIYVVSDKFKRAANAWSLRGIRYTRFDFA